jgi:hypothetical protein
MVGMWRHVEQQSIHLGVDGGWSWYAFPFSIHLTEQKNKDKGTSFPVLRFTPETSVQSFLLAQAESRDRLAAAYQPRAALTEPDSVLDVAEVAAALSGPREA